MAGSLKSIMHGAEVTPLQRRISSGIAGGLVFIAILIGYLAMLSAKGTLTRWLHTPVFKVLRTGDAGAYGTTSPVQNAYSQFTGGRSDLWADYDYSGCMMMTNSRSGIGITFLGSSHAKKNAFYQLRRSGRNSTFALSGSSKPVEGKGRTDTEISPEAGIWYSFRVQVKNTAGRTRLRAKIWRREAPEPTKWRIDCYDAGPLRKVKGSVGVWGSGEGEKYFDELLVVPTDPQSREAAPAVGDTPQHLLQQNFEDIPIGTHPAQWNDRIAPLDLSEALDAFSHFFQMDLVDFAGPADELGNLTAIAFLFCLNGLFAGFVLKHRIRLLHSKPSQHKRWRLPFELLLFVPFVAYSATIKGKFLLFFIIVGLFAGSLWRVFMLLLLKLSSSPERSNSRTAA